MTEKNGYVFIYGSSGAVGTNLTTRYKENNWWVGCVNTWRISQPEDKLTEEPIKNTQLITDPTDKKYQFEHINKESDLNILVDGNKNVCEQEKDILEILSAALGDKKLDAVICLADGFMVGNANKQLSAQTELMWKQIVWPAVVSASVAVAHLKEGGLFCLPGEKTALNSTPGTVAYGLAKAAVHQLTKSLATEGSALPKDTLCVGLLPVTVDSIMNTTTAKPLTDITGWTPTKYISEMVFDWSNGLERPSSGSLVLFNMKNFSHEITFFKI